MIDLLEYLVQDINIDDASNSNVKIIMYRKTDKSYNMLKPGSVITIMGLADDLIKLFKKGTRSFEDKLAKDLKRFKSTKNTFIIDLKCNYNRKIKPSIRTTSFGVEIQFRYDKKESENGAYEISDVKEFTKIPEPREIEEYIEIHNKEQ